MDTKAASFRARVREAGTERRQKNFDSLSDFDRSHEMTRYYVTKVLRRLAPGLIPDDDDDLETCFVDGPNDAGVDFIYRTDGHVLIIQAKYRQGGKPEEESEFSHFCQALTRIHPISGKGFKKREKLREMVADIDWDKDTFDLHFVSLGKATEGIRARERVGIESTSALHDLEERTEVKFLDETDLNGRLREAISASESILEEVEVRFTPNAKESPWLTHGDSQGRVSYVGRIKASQVRELYKNYQYRLFAMNIRHYVGDTSTNVGIVKTALTSPEDFYFFNNGISAVATHITPDLSLGILRCQNFSIINGAQTVRSLARAHRDSPSTVAPVQVLLRVSQISFRKEDEDFLVNITKFNNTQNAVKLSDFRSNDPVQRSMSRRFLDLQRGGKKFWYKNKRGGDSDRTKLPISMEEFSKTIHSFVLGPADVFGGAKYLFDSARGEGYSVVFGDGHEVWSDVTEEDFKRLAGTWLLCERIREHWKTERVRQEQRAADAGKEHPDPADDAASIVANALERRWMVFFTVGELLRAKYRAAGVPMEQDLRRLCKPKNVEPNAAIEEVVGRYVRAACELLIRLYRAASRSPGSGFMHRNWFRSRDTLRDIRDEVRTSEMVLEALPMLLTSPGN